LLVQRTEGVFMRVDYQVQCPGMKHPEIALRYRFLQSFDSFHRSVVRAGDTLKIVATGSSLRMPLSGTSSTSAHWLNGFTTFLLSGIHHILIGWDHLAFLLALIAGAFWMTDKTRSDASKLTQTFASRPFRQLIIVVTAFTVAHSITLSLAMTGYLQLPGGPVEIAIALSVALAAALNFFPRKHQSWTFPAGLAFSFGLIHGLGFASVMSQVATGSSTLLWSLAGFNLGVEIGQIMFVGIAYLVLTAFNRIPGATHRIAQVMSVLLVVIGLTWSVERFIELS
jgi:hypothetical protein